MTTFNDRLVLRMQHLDAAIPAPSVRPVGAGTRTRTDAPIRSWPRLRKVRVAIAIAYLLLAASLVTAQRLLYPDFPQPRLEQAIAKVFAGADCMTATAARPLVRTAMDGAGYATWTIELGDGAERARCIGAGVISTLHAVTLFPVAGRQVAGAMIWLGDQLLAQCLDRAAAMQLAASVMTSLGISDFDVRADPWGPQAISLEKADATIEHVNAGCYVSSGVQQEHGRPVVYLWGRWP
jgi:hypothetical protein